MTLLVVNLRIYFYGSGDAFTLTGAIAAQSSFIFENIHLENKGFPGTNNGIKVSNAAFSGGISLIGSAITYFSSGIQANQSQPFGYLYIKNSALYFNSTWGIAFNGNIVNIEDTTISNNGPLWTAANNTFDANPVGGGLLIEFASTSVTIGQGCDFEGMTVGIFIRGAYGASIQGGYFESIAKCSIQATNCVGLQINGNYVNPIRKAQLSF